VKATIDRYGRIVVPKALRDRQGLAPGSTLDLTTEGDAIVMRLAGHPSGLGEKEGMTVFRGHRAGDLDDALRRSREEQIGRAGGRRR
jgi:AbrB family looped-hinge helix DNA binding protein